MSQGIGQLFLILAVMICSSTSFADETVAPGKSSESSWTQPQQNAQFYQMLNACVGASRELQWKSSDLVCQDTFLFNQNLPSRQQYFYKVNPNGIERYHLPQNGKSLSKDGGIWTYSPVKIGKDVYQMEINTTVGSKDERRVQCPRVQGSKQVAVINPEPSNIPEHEQRVQQILSAHFENYVGKSFVDLWQNWPEQRRNAKENLKKIICECAKLPDLRGSIVKLSTELRSPKSVSSQFDETQIDSYNSDLNDATSCLMLLSRAD